MIIVLMVDALTIPPRPGRAVIVEAPVIVGAPAAGGSLGGGLGGLGDPERHGDALS